MGSEQVSLRSWTKEQLDAIKEERDHASLDSVVRELLLVSGTSDLNEELLKKQKEELEEHMELNNKQNFEW